jgi:hypothetical protein
MAVHTPARSLQVFTGMSKTSAKANPKNQDDGDRNRGSEPGQENQRERRDRQNMGAGNGSRIKGENQGRTRRGQGHGRDSTPEKGDSRRGQTK